MFRTGARDALLQPIRRVRTLLVVICLGALAAPSGVEPALATGATPLPAPTEGRLVTSQGEERVDVPLAHTDVQIRVAGHLADVTVTQTFHNPFPDKIEAVYLFPLPTGAAVHALDLRVGARVIRGAIRRRDEARQVYERARERGHVAALLTQERPNLFTQAVANIEPGARIDVTLRYSQALAYENGAYELVFPMVAGPRYLPGSAGPAERAPGQASGQAPGQAIVQPAVLPPGMRPAHDISLQVALDAGVPVRDITSPSHRIDVTRPAAATPGARASVRIAPADSIPNKDFILRYAVAGPAPAFAVLAHRDGDQGAFFLLAQPPAGPAQVEPREIVFVLDTSSSMAGAPLAKARELIHRVLGGLRPDDTYQIIRFADTASALGPRPLASKPQNLGHTRAWLDALQASGGTEMVSGIRAALEVPHDPARLRIVVFVTDGYIGNEDEILAMVARHMGEARLFSFGVGSAVNRYLLEEMAAMGRGAAQIVRPDEDTRAAVQRFHDRIDAPVLTDIRIDWNGLAVTDTVPARVPDLFAGQPLVVAGHYQAPGRATVTVHGQQAGRAVSFQVPVDLPAHAPAHPSPAHPSIGRVWARARMAELERALVRRADPALEAQILALALQHQLMSRYTAFVAVDESRVTAGEAAREVKVPVEVPEHVRGIRAGGGMGIGYASAYGIGSGSGGGGIGYGSAIGHGAFGVIGHGSAPGTQVVIEAPQVRIGGAVVTGSLDKDIIRRHVRQKLPAIRYCYEKALVSDRALAGTLVAEFSITPEGATTSISVSGVGGDTLHACVTSLVRHLRFPKFAGDGLVRVRYPFELRPAEPGHKSKDPEPSSDEPGGTL
jgi:Ca-activated chloride channel family protein